MSTYAVPVSEVEWPIPSGTMEAQVWMYDPKNRKWLEHPVPHAWQGRSLRVPVYGNPGLIMTYKLQTHRNWVWLDETTTIPNDIFSRFRS